MADEDPAMHRKHHGRYSFIPAGLLIGLGVGLLVGYPAQGILIGLGLGMIGSSLIHPCEGETTAGGACFGTKQWELMILGAFLVLVGLAMVYTSLNIWPYLIPAFLILLGLWFLARSIFHL